MLLGKPFLCSTSDLQLIVWQYMAFLWDVLLPTILSWVLGIIMNRNNTHP